MLFIQLLGKFSRVLLVSLEVLLRQFFCAVTRLTNIMDVPLTNVEGLQEVGQANSIAFHGDCPAKSTKLLASIQPREDKEHRPRGDHFAD
jgi:hypothetical protein